MEFGRFHEFLSLPGHSDTEAIDEGMEQPAADRRISPPLRLAIVYRTRREAASLTYEGGPR